MVMANRLFQSVIYQMKDVVDRVLGVIDENGTVISCSELVMIGEVRSSAASELAYSSETLVADGWTYKPISMREKSDYSVFVEGEDEVAGRYASIIAISLSNLKQFFDEKYDKTNFVKNIMLDNILPGDIYLKSKEFKFKNDVGRVVFLIRSEVRSENSAFYVIQNLFPDKNRDFVISMNENDIVLVKEVKPTIDYKELELLGKTIIDTLSSEFFAQTHVGIGTIVNNIKEIGQSFKEAQVALEVGKVFDDEKNIVSYENLGIGRLIYQLPTTLCEMFLTEVFKKGSIDSLDHETLFTIQKFFENNLNVSETSRKLFVHRNTLVYRLEKIKKLTGLDIREFDHAIIFKVALMVKKYLDSNTIKM